MIRFFNARRYVTWAAILLLLPIIHAQEQRTVQPVSCDELRSMQAAYFGFRPSKMNKIKLREKSRELNEFWQRATVTGSAIVPCLSALLEEKSDDPFFAYNGAALLYTIDKSMPSLRAVRSSLLNTDIKELQSNAFLRFILELRKHDLDTGPLINKFVQTPDVRTHFPQHSMTLDAYSAGIFLYGAMADTQAVRYLSMILNGGSDARQIAARLLGMQMSETSLQVLDTAIEAGIVADSTRLEIRGVMQQGQVAADASATYSREEITARLRQVPDADETFSGFSGDADLIQSAILNLRADDIALLRSARQRVISNFSDEGLYEYFALSVILSGVIQQQDLFRDYRRHLL